MAALTLKVDIIINAANVVKILFMIKVVVIFMVIYEFLSLFRYIQAVIWLNEMLIK